MTESTVEEVRYDLEVPYAGLALEDCAHLVRLSGLWQARNSKIRAERFRAEAEGPVTLR